MLFVARSHYALLGASILAVAALACGDPPTAPTSVENDGGQDANVELTNNEEGVPSSSGFQPSNDGATPTIFSADGGNDSSSTTTPGVVTYDERLLTNAPSVSAPY